MRYKTRFSIYTVDSRWFQCNACFSVCLQCLFRRQLIFFSMVIFMLMLRLSFNAPDSSISPTVAVCSRISNQHFQQQLYWSILCIRITGRTWCGASQCPSSLLMRESVWDTLASPDQWSSLVPWLTLQGRDYSETSLSSSLLLVSIKIISECFWSWNNILILKSWNMFSFRTWHDRRRRQVWYCETVCHQRYHGQGEARSAGRDPQRRGQVELRAVLPHRDPRQSRLQADDQGL